MISTFWYSLNLLDFDKNIYFIYFSLLDMSDEEIQAQDLVIHGEIDDALTIYQRLEPESVRILNIIGDLYVEKKGNFERAMIYYGKALELQEKVNR